MNGLAGINIELTSRCNKSCWMCGRRKMEKNHPELCDWGDMPLEMVAKIAPQIPKGVMIQFHWNGEPLLYPSLGTALSFFRGHYCSLDTNGKLLMEKRGEFIPYLSSITVSVIPEDPEGEEQLDIAMDFVALAKRPLVVFRLLGNIDVRREYLINGMAKRYPKVAVCHRVLHKPEGSFGYEKVVTVPETGICLEMLHKLAIDRYGNVFPCVRYDPHKLNLIGNIEDFTLEELWHSEKCMDWINHHINGRRDLVPLCKNCEFWGIPRG